MTTPIHALRPHSYGALSLLLLVLPLTAGCPGPGTPDQGSPPAPLPPRGAPAPIEVSADPWTLSTDSCDGDYRGLYLGSGLLGQRLDQTGLGSGAQTPAFMAGLYENEGIVTLPSLFPLKIQCGGKTFGAEPAAVKKYHQELRLKDGLLVTRAAWDTGSGEADLEIESAVLRGQPDTALARVRIRNRGTGEVTLSLASEGGSAAASGRGTWVGTFSGSGVTYYSAVRSLAGGGAASGTSVAAGQTGRFAVVTQVVRGGVIFKRLPFEPPDADRWLDEHRKGWQALWARDIEIDGDPEAQEVVRACLFYLFSSIREGSGAGVPPMGLSSNSFSGHVFWDMDSWMLPALLPQHPELAKAMLEYRYRTLAGARANAKSEGLPGASYAWESAVTGKETLDKGATFSLGRHVTGDVALALKQYYAATADREWLKSRAWPILQATAENWAARAKREKGGYVVKQVSTPDENAGLVDHSAWTHHVARVNLEFAAEVARRLGRPAPAKWTDVAKGLTFLRDADGLILSYAGFKPTSKSKQADALLLLFPGGLDLPEAEQKRMYDFYTPRVIANGPAMTDAIDTVVAARLGLADEALKRFRESYRPFVRPPYHMFSEKRTRDSLCFLTGAAGVVEAVLYGFAGLRLEPDSKNPARPRLEPHLPAGWKALRLHGVQWRGKRWDVELKPGAAPEWKAG